MREKNYTLGLVSVSFRGNAPREILEAARAAGLSCIEWGSDVHAPYHDVARLNEIVELQKEYGMFCSSYGTYFRLGETPIEELGDYIAAAKLLGTDILRLWCGNKSGAELSEQERQSMLDICKQAALIAKREGVTLCMECHKKTFTERLCDALWLMEQVNSPNFQMYWQPFQWKTEEENLVYAERIAPFARHIHVFQWKGDKKLPLGGGIEEWQRYLDKFSKPRTLLLEFMPNGQIEELAAETASLKKITGELI